MTTLILAALTLLPGCDRAPEEKASDSGVQRQVIQGFQTTFYRVNDGNQRWIEIAIAVDRSKTFRMPVFFTKDGELTQVGDQEADRLIDQWIKKQAQDVAATGSIDPQSGLNGPFLAIDKSNP